MSSDQWQLLGGLGLSLLLLGWMIRTGIAERQRQKIEQSLRKALELFECSRERVESLLQGIAIEMEQLTLEIRRGKEKGESDPDKLDHYQVLANRFWDTARLAYKLGIIPGVPSKYSAYLPGTRQKTLCAAPPEFRAGRI